MLCIYFRTIFHGGVESSGVEFTVVDFVSPLYMHYHGIESSSVELTVVDFESPLYMHLYSA